jgi:hypothetical protein
MSRFLWTQKEDIGPSARFGHAMTYDPVRSRTILFGGSLFIGNQVGTVNDTWEWNGEFWTQIADTCPFRKIHPAQIRVVRQNHRIIENDVCNPSRARNAFCRPVQIAVPA